MAIFDGTDFKGPIEGSELPTSPGVYLVCTESAGGLKILGAYCDENMRSSFASNPKADCWKKHVDKGLDVYYYATDVSKTKLEAICRRTIDNRWYKVECNDPPQDDF